MEPIYYIIKDGQQIGPLTPEQLVAQGLNPHSAIWYPGLTDWTRAENIPELAAYLYGNPKQQYPGQKESAYGQPNEPYGRANQPYGQPNPPYGQPYEQPYQQPYGQSYQQPYGQSYHQPYNPQGEYRRSKWMTASIVATIIGFLFSCIGGVLGVIGIIQASNANNAYERGNIAEGNRCDANAKIWTIISYVLSGLGLLCSITFFAIGLL